MSENIMTIRTERTPNPNSLKYNLGRVILPGSSANFPQADSADRSPLAKRLFTVSGVVAVFLGSDFVTITKEEGASWPEINEGLAPTLEAFFESGEPILTGVAVADEQEIGAETADPAVVDKIKQLIEEKVRPAVAQDGGDIVYRGFENGVVFLEMKGACSGCPSAGFTLKNGVENMLIHYVDEVTEVRAI